MIGERSGENLVLYEWRDEEGERGTEGHAAVSGCLLQVDGPYPFNKFYVIRIDIYEARKREESEAVYVDINRKSLSASKAIESAVRVKNNLHDALVRWANGHLKDIAHDFEAFYGSYSKIDN